MVHATDQVFSDPARSRSYEGGDSTHPLDRPNGIDLRTWMATQFMARRLHLFGASTPLTESAADECAIECLLAVDALIKALNAPQEVKP